jgi:hypothetical protein
MVSRPALRAFDPGAADRALAAVLVPPTSPHVARPPAWDGTPSGEPVPLCHPADDCSVQVELRDGGRRYQATAGSFLLDQLEPLQPPFGSPLDAWRFALRDAVFSGEDGDCAFVAELVVQQPAP